MNNLTLYLDVLRIGTKVRPLSVAHNFLVQQWHHIITQHETESERSFLLGMSSLYHKFPTSRLDDPHLRYNLLEYNRYVAKQSKESDISLSSDTILIFTEFVRFLPTEVIVDEIYRSLLGETTDWMTLFHFFSFISLSYHKSNCLYHNNNKSDTKTTEFEPLEYIIPLLEMIEKFMKEALKAQEDSKLQGMRHLMTINKTIMYFCVCSQDVNMKSLVAILLAYILTKTTSMIPTSQPANRESKDPQSVISVNETNSEKFNSVTSYPQWFYCHFVDMRNSLIKTKSERTLLVKSLTKLLTIDDSRLLEV